MAGLECAPRTIVPYCSYFGSSGILPLHPRRSPGFWRSLRIAHIRGAFALMLSAVVAGVLGFVFWAETARHHDASSPWFTASAEVSAIAFLAMVGGLNLTSIFARFLPVAGWRARRLILTSYGGAGLAGLVAAVIFLVTPLAKGLVIGGEPGRLCLRVVRDV